MTEGKSKKKTGLFCMLGLAFLLTAVWLLPPAFSQSKPAQAQPSPTPKPDTTIVVPNSPAATGVLITPQMKLEDLLRIRSLQYEQDKKLLEIQRLQARYKELQEGIAADTQTINEAVRSGAQNANVDLSRYVFDLDALKFVPRPAAAASPSPKPEEKRK